jgi:hypothetical protein
MKDTNVHYYNAATDSWIAAPYPGGQSSMTLLGVATASLPGLSLTSAPLLSLKSVSGAITAWSLPAKSLFTSIIPGSGISELRFLPASAASAFGIKVLEGTPLNLSPVISMDLSLAQVVTIPANSGITCAAWIMAG